MPRKVLVKTLLDSSFREAELVSTRADGRERYVKIRGAYSRFSNKVEKFWLDGHNAGMWVLGNLCHDRANRIRLIKIDN